ncbi:SDR family NAD(P)-dependent oxidoreductase [Streptomyces sp. DT2A-34]|uniref:SDR family NAD(P)-dependent oxidoreductase n=1 Tax=Streptomyces sp. DT2A-34 TaxID=3051182 RepID=UPI00265C157E|nr:SDR family NAD(P)-dependent oxidoreductase [Streptomyces sp. DT2A-34]MDO0916952.1 SDR family NAD(P)-dependent oxidoreductase [Streptomyces sp. DT2A-34]
MDAKFSTYMNVMDHLLPRMVARESGSIVNIIGIGGKFASPIHLPGDGAANSAPMLASAGLAAARGHAGVRVNVINPGSRSGGTPLRRRSPTRPCTSPVPARPT